ncbi:MAG: efflux transporter outer membrane subunit [Alphaproteobacteria bacterium]|nr:efflux transporter outer membrane subunit [Alphaproteobacteria bacterium]
MKIKHLVSLLAITAALSACNMAPDFLKPEVTKTEAFKEAPSEKELSAKEIGTWKVAEPSAALPRGEWWRVFGDEKLNALVEQAVAGNENVKVYAARVKQARATAKVSRSYLFPTIDNTSSFTRRQPNAVGRGLAPGSALAIENDALTSFGLNYELDVFGSVRGGWLASRLDAKAAAATYQSVKLALQADVADLYFALRATDRDIDILNRGLNLRQQNARILEKKSDAGDITELDVASSVVDLENTRSQLHAAEQRRSELEHALALALGKAPMDFAFEKENIVTKIPVIPAGLPSALLERRPDVTAAQKALEASNERIGVARAAFFPSLFLTGSGGFESDVLGSLFNWSSRSWAIGPLMTVPIFGGGRAVANLDRSKAQYEEAVHVYRGQVLESFRDVEDSLSRLRMLSRQANAQYRAEHASKRAAQIAKLRYDEGDLGYLESITARREALESERSGVEIKRARLSGTVQLIRALGGGWDAPAAKADTPADPAAPAKAEKKNG